MTRTAFLIGLLVFSGACASSGETPPDERPEQNSDARGESGGGLWNMLEDERAKKEDRMRRDAERRAIYDDQLQRGREQVPDDQERMMQVWWKQFLDEDPRWLESRFEWRGLGDDAAEILVENLLIVLVRAFEQNKGLLYKRARSELYDMAHHSTPYLVSAVGSGHGDDVIRRHCIELLGLIGKRAMPQLLEAWDDADSEGVQLDIVRAVGAMGPDGGQDAVDFLVGVVRGEDDFRLRLAAIQGLGKSQNPAGIPVLIRSLGDDDLSVRKFAAASLGVFRDERVVEPLIDCLAAAERKYGEGERAEEVGQNCVRSLRRVSGQRFKRAEEWRRWWERR